jgi:hypothetical protein
MCKPPDTVRLVLRPVIRAVADVPRAVKSVASFSESGQPALSKPTLIFNLSISTEVEINGTMKWGV